MAEKSVVELAENWQTGFFFLVGIGIFGLVVGATVGSVTGDTGRYLGVIGGMIFGFLLGSYLLYGR